MIVEKVKFDDLNPGPLVSEATALQTLPQYN